MTPRNFKIIILTAIISLLLVSETSLKERIFHFVLGKIEKEALEPISRDELLAGSYSGMTQQTADYPYTSWIPPNDVETYENELQGKMAGIGIFRLLKDHETGEFSFIPIEDTPAVRGGLRFGDRIVKVNDEKITDLNIMGLIDKLRGDKGTTITLHVRTREAIEKAAQEKRKPNDTEGIRKLTLTRQILQQDIICGDCRKMDGSWNFLLEENPQIGYIRIIQFADLTVPDFTKALSQIESSGAKGLIIDFRGNPGGFLPAAVALANFFVPKDKLIVTTKYRDGRIKGKFLATDGPKCSLPLVILVDEESASAAEIVSACLQDHKIAAIAGTRSYGKGTIQELFPLPFNQGMLRLTDASFWRPSGVPLHRFKTSQKEDPWGVHPDAGADVPLDLFEFETALWIRDIRESLPSQEKEKALAFFHQKYKDIQLLSKSEPRSPVNALLDSNFGFKYNNTNKKKNAAETKEKFRITTLPDLKGNAPRYDRQFDKALEILNEKMKLKQNNSNITPAKKPVQLKDLLKKIPETDPNTNNIDPNLKAANLPEYEKNLDSGTADNEKKKK